MATILAAPERSVEGTSQEVVTWQAAMKRAIRTGPKLCAALGLPPEMASPAAEIEFPVFVPLEYLRRMRPGDPTDPLLVQVLAAPAEVLAGRGGVLDPVGDHDAHRGGGLLQKYQRRVLLITTGSCAVHCRYCFRRHYPYDTAAVGRAALQQALATIAQDQSLEEVILSGGDPLTLADETLAWLVEELNRIDHIRRIRLHTRVPVVIPQRVCAPLLRWLSGSKAAIYCVLHFNHAREIDQRTAHSLFALRQAGAVLLNQSVLLERVNAGIAEQLELCQRLVDCGVLPYYLHQLDPVRGATHFGVDDASARRIIAELRRQLPGYAVPKLVREVAGAPSKVPV